MTRTLGMDVRGLLNPNVTGAVIDGPAVRPLNVEQVHFADAAESHDSGSAFCLVCHATPLTGYSRVARLVLGCLGPVCAPDPRKEPSTHPRNLEARLILMQRWRWAGRRRSQS